MSSSDEDGDANGAHPFVLVRVRVRVACRVSLHHVSTDVMPRRVVTGCFLLSSQ